MAHDRKWLTPEALEQSRDLRAKVAADGVRIPVNVMDGNYTRAADVCPWWNANAPVRKDRLLQTPFSPLVPAKAGLIPSFGKLSFPLARE